ncbi:MAG: glycosyltransferase [Blastocatellia bacterium]|nr:glycosyltransferase [Blastocatellia bacterium]
MYLLICIASLAGIGLIITMVNCLFWPRLQPLSEQYSKYVSVLIPARNEERNLPDCLQSIIEQGDVILEILVYDDYSTDNTSLVVERYKQKCGKISLIDSVMLPADWCGKNHACDRMAKAAKGEWLLFLDADARLTKNAVNRMLSESIRQGTTFMSCWPRIDMYSVAEKILMPFLNFVVFSIYPAIFQFIKHPEVQYNPKLGLAHGACMLFERKSYEGFGGHSVVKAEIFEDTRIAQRWLADKRKGLCLDGQDIVHLRMYGSLAEICQGFQKNFYLAFEREGKFWAFILFHVIVYLLPFLIVVIAPSFLSLIIITFIFTIRSLLAYRFNHSFLSVLFHPIGQLIMIGIGLSSWWQCKMGKGVSWKGRQYSQNG